MSKKVEGLAWTKVESMNPGLAEKYQAFKEAEQVALEYKRAFEDDFLAQIQAKNGKLAPSQQMVFSYRWGTVSFAVKTVDSAKSKSKPTGFSL